jgi:hypothetical protein
MDQYPPAYGPGFPNNIAGPSDRVADYASRRRGTPPQGLGFQLMISVIGGVISSTNVLTRNR